MAERAGPARTGLCPPFHQPSRKNNVDILIPGDYNTFRKLAEANLRLICSI